jgi:transposase-like protein
LDELERQSPITNGTPMPRLNELERRADFSTSSGPQSATSFAGKQLVLQIVHKINKYCEKRFLLPCEVSKNNVNLPITTVILYCSRFTDKLSATCLAYIYAILLCMLRTSPSKRPYRKLTGTERRQAIDLYERGEANIRQIAEQFGLHRNTVSLHFKAAGASAGCRVEEIIGPLRQQLDEKIRKEAEAKQRREEIAFQSSAQLQDSIATLIQQFVRADREGRLTEFGLAMEFVTPRQVRAARRNTA